MWYVFVACCARTANGHVAALPTNVMNLRRLMGFPRQRTFAHYHVSKRALRWALRQIRVGDFRFGSKADIGLALVDVRFTPKSGHRQTRCHVG
jgi:hypothetical protein